MSDQFKQYYAANQANWNERAEIHLADETGFYAIDSLLEGANLLTSIEIAELGDISALKVAHLQSHIGTDTLSLARMGADEVVGIDFSPKAVTIASDLAKRTGLNARFVEGSVYDAPQLLGTDFDLAFTSWGTICWLGDIDAWAKAAAGVLNPGGRFYFADTHPAALIFEVAENGVLAPRYDYSSKKDIPLVFDDEYTYDGSSKKMENTRTYQWPYSISQTVTALIKAGFSIDFINEHEALPWQLYTIMEKHPDRLFRLPQDHVRMPLALSIGATRG